MSHTLSWKDKATEFIQRTFSDYPGYDPGDVLRYCLSLLKIMTSADITLQIRLDNAYTARVYPALPLYLEDLTFPGEQVKRILEDAKGGVQYLPDLTRIQAPFPDLFSAMYSGVLMPLHLKSGASLVLLGWSEQQHFDTGFQVFGSLVQGRLRELLRNEQYRSTTTANINLLATVFNSLRQAVIYIDDDGYVGWINYEAAGLLQLPIYGEQAASLISSAMTTLRSRAGNKAAIEQEALKLFNTKDAAIERWLWHFDHADLQYKTLRVSTRPVKNSGNSGRVWTFEDVSDMMA